MPTHLPRPRLIRKIESQLRHAPVLILAPPGYGKTILLQEYLTQHPGTVLISLRPETLEKSSLQAAIANAPPDGAILVDDIHLIDGDKDLIEWLCQQIQTESHRAWILAGRYAPQPLPTQAPTFATLHSQDLRFTAAETHHMLEKHIPASLSPRPGDDASAAYGPLTGVDGWPLAVALLRQTHIETPPPDQNSPQKTKTISQKDIPTQGGDNARAITEIHAAHLPILGLIRNLLNDLPPEQARFFCVAALPTRCHPHLLSQMLRITRQTAGTQLAALAQRNLFIQAQPTPGWYRFHDLVRECLHMEACARLGTEAVNSWLCTAATWFAAANDLPTAIDHALLADDPALAADYISQLTPTFIVDQGYFRTYLRWIHALPRSVQAQNPQFLIQLGRSRLEIGDRNGARAWLMQALDDARTQEDHEHVWLAQTALAKLYNIEGDLEQSLALCQAVINAAPPHHSAHIQALNAAGNAYTHLNRFRMARESFETALHMLTRTSDGQTVFRSEAIAHMQANLRHNLALGIYIPLGRFEAAEKHLTVNNRYYADRPAARSLHYLAWCSIHEAVGDWDKLAQDLREIEIADNHAEQPDEENNWYFWFKALYHTGIGEYDQAAALLDAAEPIMIADEDVLCQAYARIWLLRKRGESSRAGEVAREILASAHIGPYYRGMIAMEWLLCLWPPIQTGSASSHLQTGHKLPAAPLPNLSRGIASPVPIPEPIARELNGLMSARAQPWLLRLRAWLTHWELCTAQHGDDHAMRARRHIQRVLTHTEQKFYLGILIAREPELGLGFWRACLAADIQPARATHALLQLAECHNGLDVTRVVQELIPLLSHTRASVRRHTANALALLAAESALPALIAQLGTEQDSETKSALLTAIERLESAMPPPLEITLMGDFAVRRGDRLLAEDDWHRPAVRRLFQYFSLHAGQPLSRERILDDLWPDTPPTAARNTFRTLFSWLRRTLDPHLRPKSPARYFRVSGEVYCFAPAEIAERVTSDLAHFETVVQSALQPQHAVDLPKLPENLLRVLADWAPLLPELPYESWALIARERSTSLYVEGCLHAAQTLLHLQRPVEAAQWARKAIDISPWLEEAYQMLMQAQARQRRRAQALRTYAEAVDALRAELDVPPSALTEWLAQRLRQGEDI